MSEGYCFVFGLILGGLASPYCIAAIHDIERRWHERLRSQPLAPLSLPPYINPFTGKREVSYRE